MNEAHHAQPDFIQATQKSPYSSIIVRNALRFLFLTNHRLERLTHIFPGGNALRFLHRTTEIRKPKTRNATRFRRLTLVEFNLTTPDLKE
jgi:hypothetical protein